ncbi:RidA family protein [Streptomyces sp. NPDC090442]|uniref:RidA family protein n=1 Tax=Streptomyces sp. NPDC090442 TaxID=3365962 RepID=UPI0037F5C6BA
MNPPRNEHTPGHHQAVQSDRAPLPAGTYSQAVRAADFVFLSGQTPRLPTGERLNDAPFDVQARQALENLRSLARAAGGDLTDAVKVNVYLRDPSHRAEFDRIYRQYAGDPPPARTLTQSHLPGFAVEIDAVLDLPAPHQQDATTPRLRKESTRP